MSGFRKLAETVGHVGSLVSVGVATFADPSGTTFERDVVHHPGAVVVVPVTNDGRSVIMVRQYRAAIDRVLLEVPAGKRDVADEPVEVTARRELAEEIGVVAGRMSMMAEFFNSPGFCDEHSWLFLARDLQPCAPSAQGIEEAHMTIEEVALADVATLVAAGDLVDGKSILGIYLAMAALASP